MSSVLLTVSGQRQSVKVPEPSGQYDPIAQMWDNLAVAGTVKEGLDIFAATGHPTTYSATTTGGRDPDSDDKGT